MDQRRTSSPSRDTRKIGVSGRVLVGIVTLLAFGLVTLGDLAPTFEFGPEEPEEARGQVLPMTRALLTRKEPGIRMGNEKVPLSSDLRSLYLENSLSGPLWVSRTGLRERARDLLAAAEDLADHGLPVSDSRLAALRSALAVADRAEATPTERRNAELLASEVFLGAARDLSNGRMDPKDVVKAWQPAVGKEVSGEHAVRLLAGLSPSRILMSLTPDLPWYGFTLEALARYRRLARTRGGWTRVSLPADSVLEVGDEGPEVLALRSRLAQGASPEERVLAKRNEASRIFDKDLDLAVRLYQERHGLEADGIVGELTLQQLRVPLEERIEQLKLSLEKMRWLPSLGDRFIFVNVPAARLFILEDLEPVLSMDVVVGRPSWPTNMFTDTLEQVVVNPYWHVPESIEEEEILPAVREDTAYLARNHMVLVPADDNFGKPLTLDEVDLRSGEDFDFRQEPGPQNDLGRIKFLFPNPHNIYLHDTPADHLFEESRRTFSHGCIRVAEPEALARYLFAAAADPSPSDLREMLADTTRVRVNLTEPVPVHLYYLTAWATEDGTVHFFPDVYELDDAFRKERNLP